MSDTAHPTNPRLPGIAARFQLRGDFVAAEPYGSGHINDTYAVLCNEGGRRVHYILQRINHEVFKNPQALMDNIVRTTGHIRSVLHREKADDVHRRVLTLVPTHEGDDFLHSDDGSFWRVYVFIENAQTYDVITSTGQAHEAARSFGQFQRHVADLPGPRLHETIPNFHHTRSRFDALVKAVDEDTCRRLDIAREEVSFVLERERLVDVLLELQAAGELPERITHNDTKLNNVMIDDATSEGICVIDLDTVMPGLALYDFGDMVRTATNPGAEDEKDLSKISMDMEMFEALAGGYLASAGDILTPKEIELLPFAGKLITLEIGIRFLADYLSGDTYFKVHREGHNLDRCRTQFKLVQSIEAQESEMERLVRSL